MALETLQRQKRSVDTTGGTGAHEADSAPKYHTLLELGRGGTAVVSAGLARGIGGFSKLVVLKNIKEEVLGDRETVKMFVNEARLAARMNHPNIVQVYEVYRQNKLPVIVMEYLDGQALAKLQQVAFNDPAFTQAMALTILCKVLAGLEYAHALTDYDGTPLGIVHRDVSPHNVVVTYDGQVKLLDFGIAKFSSRNEETKTGVVKGKVSYMAPEQLEALQVDHRADLFAVGVMMWELVARQRLWGERSEVDIIRCLVCEEIPSLSEALPGIDPELERICKKAMAAAADDRYSNAGEFRVELETYLSRNGGPAQQTELAAFVSRVCAEQREKSQAALKAELAKFAEDAPGWEDALQAFDRVQTPPPEAAPPRAESNRTWMFAAAALLLSGGLVATYAMARRAPPAAPTTTQVASEPAPAPVQPAPAPPSTVTLKVGVEPAGAKVYLDGQFIGSAPVARAVASDAVTHELRVEAEGYEMRSESIRLASDLSVEWTLTKAAAPQPAVSDARPRAPAPPPRRRAPAAPRPDPRPEPATQPAPAAPAPAANPCAIPYYFGPDGVKHFRPECL